MLKPGQQASVWLELLMPDVNGDVFQVCRPMQYQLQRICCCSTEHCMQACAGPVLRSRTRCAAGSSGTFDTAWAHD